MNSVTRYIDALLKELINKAAKGVAHILLLIFNRPGVAGAVL